MSDQQQTLEPNIDTRPEADVPHVDEPVEWQTSQLEPVPAAPPRYVAIQPYGLQDFEHFADAVAAVISNGTLLVSHLGPDGRVDTTRPPIKGYAPNTWITFEHVGDYTPPPTARPAALAVRPAEMSNEERRRFMARQEAYNTGEIRATPDVTPEQASELVASFRNTYPHLFEMDRTSRPRQRADQLQRIDPAAITELADTARKYVGRQPLLPRDGGARATNYVAQAEDRTVVRAVEAADGERRSVRPPRLAVIADPEGGGVAAPKAGRGAEVPTDGPNTDRWSLKKFWERMRDRLDASSDWDTAVGEEAPDAPR